MPALATRSVEPADVDVLLDRFGCRRRGDADEGLRLGDAPPERPA